VCHDQDNTSIDFKDSKKIHCDATLRNGQFNTQLRLLLGTLENAPKGKCGLSQHKEQMLMAGLMSLVGAPQLCLSSCL